MINIEIPIRKYKVIQTGPNTHAGGFRIGLLSSKYHVFTELIVNKDPIIPASWQINKLLINLYILFISLILLNTLFNKTNIRII